jgi:folate-binding Fe-S cluster repair protein YgfZ
MYYCKLKKKAIICIEGKDATSFLQGIITNNTNKLKNNRVIYSTLLSPQGKLLHDFFLFEDMKKFYLDAPKYNIKKLKEKLNLYKLNRDINISEKKIYSYFVFFGKSVNKILGITEKLGEYKEVGSTKIFNDPRNINLGTRIICDNKEG